MLQVEHGQVPVGREDGPSGPLGTLLHDRPSRGGANPGMVNHRWKVHIVDVVVPIDDGGIEAELLVILLVEGVPQVDQAIDAVTGVGLGVCPVKLDVAEGTLGQGMSVLYARRQIGLFAPYRHGGQQASRQWSWPDRPGGVGVAPARARGRTTRAR